MAISETQKVDYLWKKLGYGLSKTDTNANKRATNESIASPLLLSGENVWGQSDQIPATIPGSSSGVVTIYPTSSPDETTADTSATTNRTWKTELTDWIPPEFGSTYLVKAYIHTAGDAGNAASAGTQVFGAGSGNDDEWFFDYQSGILHFIGTNLPSGISGKSLYISGARYTGIKGVAVPGAGVTFTSTDVESLSVSGLSTFTGAIDANGDLDVDGHTELDSVNVSAASTFGGLLDINAGAQANTLKVEDLTDNRVVIAGTGGELEDDANLTFDGSTLSVGVDLDVGGHTELDDLNVSGISTFEDGLTIGGSFSGTDGVVIKAPNSGSRQILKLFGGSSTDGKVVIQGHGPNNNNLVANALGATELWWAESGNTAKKFETTGYGVSVFGTARTQQLEVTGVSTFTGAIDANGSLDVDGHTELDDVNISGVLTATTISGIVTFTSTETNVLGNVNTGAVQIDGGVGIASNLTVGAGLSVNASASFHNNLVSMFSGALIDGGLTVFDGINVSNQSTFTGDVTIQDINSGSAAGPELKLYRNSSSPADADYLGQIKFAGESDTGVERNYAKITGKIDDASNTNEDGILEFAFIKAGSQNINARFKSTELMLLNGTDFSVAGDSTFTGAIDANGDLDVDGHTELDDVNVSGASTFTGAIDANGGLDVSGGSGLVASSAKISDLTDNRIVIAGTAGELEDDSKLTFDGSTFTVQAAASFNGNVSIGGTLTYEDVTSVDSVGLITARKGIVIDSGGLVITSGVATFTDNIQANGNIVGDNSTNISGINQVTATTFVGNLTGTATTATNLANAANITTGTISDDRLPASITSDITGNAATATTATNLANAANITTGTISDDRLPASITSDITGNAATASLATTATNLANAANITTGTISDDRLPATITSDITGNAATASLATTATNLAGGDTGDIPYQSANGTTTFVDASGAGTNQVLLWSGSAPIWSDVSGAAGNFGGITLQEEGSTVGTAGSVTGFNFVGDNITATASSGIGFGTITVSDTPTFDSLKVTGITTIPNVSGVTTFSDIVNVGTGITIYPATGIISATQFYGGGENLTDLVNQKIEGVMVLADGVPVGTGFTFSNLNFIGNSVSATGVGTTANITITGFDPDADQNLFAGTCAGGTYDPASGTACFNVFIGSCAGKSISEGDNNVFLGRLAGCSNNTGTSNLFLGNNVGAANTDGAKNIYIGSSIAENAVSSCANANIVIGQLAAKYISGNCNIILGCCTGGVAATLTGDHNFIAGFCAGKCQTTGDNNLIIGQNAGQSNTGSDNVMFGTSAGNGNTGDNNFFTGSNAGANNTGTSNVFLGTNAGIANTTGSCNIMIGLGAGKCATLTSSTNTFLGRYAGKCATGASSNNNFIGLCAGCGTTGSQNNFMGRCAGHCNTTGSYNNYIGERAGAGFNGSGTTGSQNNFFGSCAGCCNQSGSCNNFIGQSAGKGNLTGSQNVYIGDRVGTASTTGSANVMIGKCAGVSAAVTGSDNIFLGTDAGKSASGSGTDNTFIGHNAGRSNSSGSFNNFIGRQAGYENTIGTYNVFLGDKAGNCNTEGCFNTFIGFCAGRQNTTGCDNVFLGNAAGVNATTGCYNIFFGKCSAAGGIVTEGCNVAMGLCAGYSLTSGCDNVMFGKDAGYNSADASTNVFLGQQAGCTNTSGDSNIAIGCQVSLSSATGSCQLAIGNGSDRWIAGDSSFNVTIANKLLVNASGIVTASSGIVTYYGDGSQLSGLGQSDKITEGNTEVEVIDTGSDGHVKFTTEGSERARIDASGRMGIGVTNPVAKLEVNVGSAVTAFDIQGSAGQLFSVTNNLTSGSIFSVNDVSGIPSIDVDADGTIQLAPFSTTEMVGVGTTNPTTKLHVVGEVTATDFNATSDARLKTNVQIIDDPLEKVLQINGVSFNWVENNKPSMGVIADNIEEVLPELVSDTDPKTVNYNGLIGLLIEVVKDQQTQINSLNERLSQLE